ncbi:MAG: Rieske 2Fe-2S domain-containing protein, partial [Chloroflexota bacterium]
VTKIDPIITRREFLHYVSFGILGFSALLVSKFIVDILSPTFRGSAGYRYFSFHKFPDPGESPILYENGEFWLAHTDKGVVALYNVCPHLGCLYRWSDISRQFECPCAGSKFALDGTYITGPSPRSLDRFWLYVSDETGHQIGQANMIGDPLPIPLNAVLTIDTFDLILGKPR